MPPSIQYTHEVRAPGGFQEAIACAPNLAELLELVPAPYRSRMQDLVNKVYRAAVKSNNTRSYLVALEKHVLDGDFPPEIGGRIASPALQISKEFMATSEYRSLQAKFDDSTLKSKKAALESAISMKKKELSYLQSLFAEDTYKGEADVIINEVVEILVNDARLRTKSEDGSSAEATWPTWIGADYVKMKKWRLAYPARAVALAFIQVS